MIFDENVEKTPTVKVYTTEIISPLLWWNPGCLLSFKVPLCFHTFGLFVYALPQNEKEFEAARISLIESSPKFCFLKHESNFIPVLLQRNIKMNWSWWSSGRSSCSKEPGGISTAVGVPRPGFGDTYSWPSTQALHAGEDAKMGLLSDVVTRDYEEIH